MATNARPTRIAEHAAAQPQTSSASGPAGRHAVGTAAAPPRPRRRARGQCCAEALCLLLAWGAALARSRGRRGCCIDKFRKDWPKYNPKDSLIKLVAISSQQTDTYMPQQWVHLSRNDSYTDLQRACSRRALYFSRIFAD
jgi:hypothetical protein